MEELLSFLNYNWAELLLIVGMLLLLRTDVYSDKRMTDNMKITLLFLLLYSIVNYVEAWYGTQDNFSIWRSVLTVLNYGIPAFIILRIIMLFFRLDNRLMYLPAVINLICCTISVFTGLVFSFSSQNQFQRGPLNFLPFSVNGLYLLYFGFLAVRSSLSSSREDRMILVFLLASAFFVILMPLLPGNNFDRWISTTITLDVVLYYIFILHQMAKRDSLTRLLNRQSFYADSERLSNKITALILIDMNGLKVINDKEGHLAGDTALMTLADCLLRCTSGGQRLYRIGGDEYVILCTRSDAEKTAASIQKIRTELAKTPYSCSIGYAIAENGITAEQLYSKADSLMYQDKAKYYRTHERYR